MAHMSVILVGVSRRVYCHLKCLRKKGCTFRLVTLVDCFNDLASKQCFQAVLPGLGIKKSSTRHSCWCDSVV